MNGYRARVQAHRRRMVESRPDAQRTATPDLNWFLTIVDALADAAHTPRPRRPAAAAEQEARTDG